ncbi:MAG: hypothetical protein ACRDLM_10745 [Gaiellaceae bacterium]
MNRYKLLTGLFVLDVALFALAGIPAFKHADHGIKWVLGGIGWLGGLACTLVLIVLALTTLVQHARARRTRTV